MLALVEPTKPKALVDYYLQVLRTREMMLLAQLAAIYKTMSCNELITSNFLIVRSKINYITFCTLYDDLTKQKL